MKKVITIVTLLMLAHAVYPQSASAYFPTQVGAVWYYYQSVLDSLNNPVDSLSLFSADSFTVQGEFHGKNSNLIMTKYGSADVLEYSPYLDSSFVALEGSDASVYLNFLSSVDTSAVPDSGIIALLKSFEGWYPNYQFDAALNENYEILTKDTIITLDSNDYSIRINAEGKRLGAETVETELGNLSAEKFQVTLTIYFLVEVVPGFPPVAIPIMSFDNSIWISEGRWIIKSYVPSSVVDLSTIGGPSFYIPGSEKILVNKPAPVDVKDNSGSITGFYLFRNYPNPFNPSTVISYQIPKESSVSLKIYDIAGREIAVLVDKRQQAGKYTVNFNADIDGGLASGIYIYRLRAGSFAESRKALLIK